MPPVTGRQGAHPLSDRLRAALLERLAQETMSVATLARELGYDRSNVGRWLNGETTPSSGLLDAAEAYLAKHGVLLSRTKS